MSQSITESLGHCFKFYGTCGTSKLQVILMPYQPYIDFCWRSVACLEQLINFSKVTGNSPAINIPKLDFYGKIFLNYFAAGIIILPQTQLRVEWFV